jgi:hypothetical protein
MAHHLAQSCGACAQFVEQTERVDEAASAEATVPEYLVLAAKAVFPARLPSTSLLSWPSLPRVVGELVSTKIATPAADGGSRAADSAIQSTYHAGDYAIDLEITREPESTELAVVGQIVNRASSGAPLPGLPVLLMSQKKLVAQANSNRFGEFCLVSKEQSGLELCLPIETAGKLLEISLTKVLVGI